jgi:predicted nucleotidyltransferase
MMREKVLTILSENRKLLTNYGVREIRLFGSVARGQARAGSDVDLLVEFEPSAHIGLFEFSRLKNELSQLLGCAVDLATPDAIHKSIKEDVLREAIRAT